MRGFSLMEMMVVTGVVGIVSGVIGAVFLMGQRSWQVEQARVSVSLELRKGMDAMCREITETSQGQLSIPANGTWSTSLTFRTPADLDGNGTILNGAGAMEWSVPITYSLGGNQLQRSQNAAIQVLGNGVTSLQFRRQAAVPGIVEVAITVQRTAGSSFSNQATLNTSVQVRN